MRLLEPWNFAFLIGLVVYIAIRHVYIKRTRNVPKVDRRIDALERFLLGIMAVPVMILPLLNVLTPLLSFADYRLPPIMPWLGVVTMVASLVLFWRSHEDLGNNWSVSLELSEGHSLVTRGVYRRVRHPMYSSIWLWGLAQGLMLQNWLAGWGTLVAFATLYFTRVPREEAMMLDRFGDEYRTYMRRTGRLCPKFPWRSDV